MIQLAAMVTDSDVIITCSRFGLIFLLDQIRVHSCGRHELNLRFFFPFHILEFTYAVYVQ
jgi:hypothetical protein